MNMINLKNLKYEKSGVKISLLVLLFIFMISIVWFFFSKPGKRYNVCFESVNSKSYTIEYMYLPIKKYPENVVQYVNEIILGPKLENSKFIFTPGTSVISCFVRDDILYVNLTDDILDRVTRSSEIIRGIELFKMNILNNFSKINSVEMYIENKSVFNYD